MDFLVTIGDYVVENLPAIAAAGYAAVMAFKANKRAKTATGESKTAVKCRKLVKEDVYGLLDYHQKEAAKLQKLLDYMYTEDGENNGNVDSLA